MTRFLQVAIDGPVASGKGTVAYLLAERLGIPYIDTGAMYRVAAYAAKVLGISWDDEEGVASVAQRARIEIRSPGDRERDGRLLTVVLDGGDVTWAIRGGE